MSSPCSLSPFNFGMAEPTESEYFAYCPPYFEQSVGYVISDTNVMTVCVVRHADIKITDTG